MTIQYTPIYQIPYPQASDPIKTTQTTLENQAKRVETILQQGSFPASNPDVASITARLNALENTFVDVNKTDTNWAYAGGLFVGRAVNGYKRVSLTLKLTRVGGAFTATTSAVQAIVLIPLAYKPGYDIRHSSIMCGSNGDFIWGMHYTINKDGVFYVATDGGSVSVGTGNILHLDLSWMAAA